MTEQQPQAMVRRNKAWLLIWVIPVIALAIVVWLGVKNLFERGPLVSITFDTASGVTVGSTKVRHKDVEVGTVEGVALSDDLSHVIVKARLNRDIGDHITNSSQFWVVRPRLSAAGVSGLNTLVSGAYIEVDPGKPGAPQTEFKGLEEPPTINSDQPGRAFALRGNQLGSLAQGSPIYLRGVSVGEVMRSEMTPDGDSVVISIFIHAPYDKFVRKRTRFWNSSGISLTAGSDGIRANIESLQSLIAGGVAFETPKEADKEPEAPAEQAFTLYNDQSAAESESARTPVDFLVQFPGPVDGLSVGALVTLKGIKVGRVTDVHLEYDHKTASLISVTTVEIFPELMQQINPDIPVIGDASDAIYTTFRELVSKGLRATLASGNLLTGQKIASLDFDDNAPPARLGEGKTFPEIPAIESGDLGSLTRSTNQLVRKFSALPIAEIGKSIRNIADNLDKLSGSPETKDSLRKLDIALSNLDKLTGGNTTADLPTLIASLNKTADAASQTLGTATHQLGGDGQRGSEAQNMFRELTGAARSVRALADFLSQHPEALIRGRTAEGQ